MGSSPTLDHLGRGSSWITLVTWIDPDLLPVTALDVQKLLVSAPRHQNSMGQGRHPRTQLFHGKIIRRSIYRLD